MPWRDAMVFYPAELSPLLRGGVGDRDVQRSPLRAESCMCITYSPKSFRFSCYLVSCTESMLPISREMAVRSVLRQSAQAYV